MDEITYRPVTDEEYPVFARALVEGFGDDIPDDEFSDLLKATLPPSRTIAAFDGDEIVGTFGGYDLTLTVPGGSLPMEGTTVVTVFPTHRRLGIMGEMMRNHLDNAVKNGYAVAGLWASASNIYGRYSYGVASYSETIEMQSSDIVFRENLEIDRVRRVSVEDALGLLPQIFKRALPETPGMYARTDEWWRESVLNDAAWRKNGKSSLRVVVHDGVDGPDGYAIYRQKPSESDDGHAAGRVHVSDLIATTDLAHTSLWSYLTNVDGFPNIRWWNHRIDDPLYAKVAKERKIDKKTRFDALYLVLLDVVTALESRTYEKDGFIRFTVTNSYRSETDGSYELVVKDGVGTCTRIEGWCELEVDLDVLGALYLGGSGASAFGAAGRMRGDADLICQLGALFRTAREPWCNQVF